MIPYLILIFIILKSSQILGFLGLITLYYWPFSKQSKLHEIFFACRFDYFFDQNSEQTKNLSLIENYFYWKRVLPFIPQSIVSKKTFINYIVVSERQKFTENLKKIIEKKKKITNLKMQKVIFEFQKRKHVFFFTIDKINFKKRKISGTLSNYKTAKF